MKMYKQPEIEVMNLNGAGLMQDLVVSYGAGDSNNPPAPGAPGRRGDIID